MAGASRLNATALSRDWRLGIVTNDVATMPDGKPVRKALIQQGYQIIRIFSPEHGINAIGEDGAPQPNRTDSLTGLPVVSLYGKHMSPTGNDLEDLDAILFDIPDIGCRFYTYLWTLTYVMESCAAANIPLWLLDRPNPTGGRLSLAEGPMLDEEHCSSFIGRWRIPIRHCCTLGELAQFFKATRLPNLHLIVVPCTGWKQRESFLANPGCFVPTSPAIQDVHSALLYPGTGLWEGINVSEGRFTEAPFSQMGAPWIDGEALAIAANQLHLSGVDFKRVAFQPTSGKFAGIMCHGVKLSITDEYNFRPVVTGVALLQLLKKTYSTQLTPARYPTVANPLGNNHLDKLLGIPNAFDTLDSKNFSDLLNITPAWTNTMQPYLLY